MESKAGFFLCSNILPDLLLEYEDTLGSFGFDWRGRGYFSRFLKGPKNSIWKSALNQRTVWHTQNTYPFSSRLTIQNTFHIWWSGWKLPTGCALFIGLGYLHLKKNKAPVTFIGRSPIPKLPTQITQLTQPNSPVDVLNPIHIVTTRCTQSVRIWNTWSTSWSTTAFTRPLEVMWTLFSVDVQHVNSLVNMG